MIPEHVEALRVHREQQKKIPKHQLDEQELQELGYVAINALKHTLPVRITYWKDWSYLDLEGIIYRVEIDLKQIKVILDENDVEFIPVDCLKSIQLL